MVAVSSYNCGLPAIRVPLMLEPGVTIPECWRLEEVLGGRVYAAAAPKSPLRRERGAAVTAEVEFPPATMLVDPFETGGMLELCERGLGKKLAVDPEWGTPLSSYSCCCFTTFCCFCFWRASAICS